jgi:hypothetical protein
VPNAVWLPDSSGFLFVALDRDREQSHLLHYDLKTKKLRVLAKDIKGQLFYPAISPDGNHIAFAEVKFDENKNSTVHVVVINPQGKELHRSKPIRWSESKEQDKDFRSMTYVFWVPKQEKLLINTDMHTGIYDIKTGQMTRVEGYGFLTVVMNSPIRPDGAGFLQTTMTKPKDGPDGAAFVGWDGKRTAITPKGEPNEDDFRALAFSTLFSARWQGNTALIEGENGRRLAIDTTKLQMTVEEFKPQTVGKGETVARQFTFAETKVTVRSVKLRQESKDGSAYRVEILKPDAAKPHVLSTRCVLDCRSLSPDGKLLALVVYEKIDEPLVFVVNARGELVDTVNYSKMLE